MDTDQNTRRILERKALANVRALVDKVEAEDRNRTVGAVKFTAGVLPILLVVAGSLLLAVAVVRLMQPSVIPARSLPEYVERVLARIERAGKEDRSRMGGLDGRVQLAFRVRRDGYIENLEVRKSSFNAQVDGFATRMVKAAEPFERIPDHVATAPIDLTVTARFDRKDGSTSVFSIERQAR